MGNEADTNKKKKKAKETNCHGQKKMECKTD